jgi:hypothetical protein
MEGDLRLKMSFNFKSASSSPVVFSSVVPEFSS